MEQKTKTRKVFAEATNKLLKKALGIFTAATIFLKFVTKFEPKSIIGGKEYISFVAKVDMIQIPIFTYPFSG
jgi:hypothetical protein